MNLIQTEVFIIPKGMAVQDRFGPILQGLLAFVGFENPLYFCPPTTQDMKEGIHPDNYRMVIFKDLTADWRFLGKSCAESKETEKWEDGKEYPVIKVEVSSASHPFFTGKNTLVDTAGRIDKFRTRYAKHKK